MLIKRLLYRINMINIPIKKIGHFYFFALILIFLSLIVYFDSIKKHENQQYILSGENIQNLYKIFTKDKNHQRRKFFR